MKPANNTYYLSEDDESAGYFKVEYLVNNTGVALVKHFDSPYLARKFMEKIKRSKKTMLLGTEGF